MTFFLDLPFRWNNIAHISLNSSANVINSSGLSPSNVLKLLRQCPRLVSLAFPGNNNLDWDHDTFVSKTISLPFLKSFIIFEPRVLDLQTIGQLLQRLVTPELRQLHIPSVSSSSLENHSLLFAIGNLPLLDNLLVHLRSLAEPTILETLRSLPLLTKLTVSNSNNWHWTLIFDDEDSGSCDLERLLVLLTPGESESTVCPRLQELEMNDCHSVSKETIGAFIRRRIGLDSGFQRLEMTWGVPQDGELVSPEEIQEIHSHGVQVALIFPSQGRVRERSGANAWTGLPVMKSQTRWGGWD
ncbi:hypothetical protein FB45DRAFT_1018793 [Roridomyces roridus]|uniref:Uncharacterized protein n=1 Tax=Roridomyces roridus TaxID=1738132 RepID=A0AAD7FZM4_9AGAR|nr:hypothetical protein FB45DRAFT_1018793 [Roridomyces roridus]